MLFEVKALVIRTVDLSESDRLITLFSDQYGLITAYANNSRSLRSKYMSSAQLFCYASFVLYKKGDRYWVREVSLIESFFDLRADLTRTALASYVCDVAGDVVEENAPEPEMLSLTLNTLFAIASGAYSLSLVKAAFELRAASVLGFRPMLDACMHCAKTDEGLCLEADGNTTDNLLQVEIFHHFVFIQHIADIAAVALVPAQTVHICGCFSHFLHKGSC